MRFSRRQLLWTSYGPEAFADPPITDREIEGSVGASTFTVAMLLGIPLVAALPVFVWLSRNWLGAADLCFLIFAWLVVAASLIWLLVARRHPRDDEPGGHAWTADETSLGPRVFGLEDDSAEGSSSGTPPSAPD